MSVSYSFIDATSLFSSAILNSAFQSLVDGINDIRPWDCVEGALEREHFDGELVSDPTTTGLDPSSQTAITSQYPTFVVATDGTNDCEHSFTAVNLTSSRFKAIMVLANVSVTKIEETNFGALLKSYRAMARISWWDGSKWTSVPRTTRSLSQEDIIGTEMDIPIRTVLTISDTGANSVSKVRLEMCGNDASGGTGLQVEASIKDCSISSFALHCETS